MIKRICPNYKEEHYSADTTNNTWTCNKCKSPITKEHEKPINKEDN